LLKGIFALLLIFYSLQSWPAGPRHNLFLRSVEYYKQKDYARSRAMLRRLVRAEPSNALYWFNLGNANFMLGDFANAERSFARVERLRSPLAVPAKLYRAKALRERGDRAQAKKVLQGFLAQAHLPPSLREEGVREMLLLQDKVAVSGPEQEALELYRRGEYRRALRLIRRQKNPGEELIILKAMVLIKLEREDEAISLLKESGSSSVLVTALLDRIRDTHSKPKWLFVEAATGFDSNVRQTPASEGSAVFLTDFGAGRRLWSEDLWHLSAGYIGRLRETVNKTDLRVLLHEVQSSLGREVGTDLVLVTPFAQHESWGANAVRVNAGLRSRLRTGNERWEAGMDSAVTRHSALRPEFSGLSGATIQGRFYAGMVSYPVYGQAFLDVERHQLGDPTYSNKSWAPGVRLLWKYNSEWAAQVSASYRTREYGAYTNSETDLNGRVTHFFSPQLSGYVLVDQLRGDIYKQTQALVGIVWDMY